jgi:peptidoglycan/xylan/chitin deacetylase (PgdA/CDA1 family)
MQLFVLAYHSHHVVGDTYALNDHSAFAQDLRTIANCRYRIVPLSAIVDAAESYRDKKEKLVALTFDDGPVYDVDDFVHPEFGPQVSFLNSMRRFRDEVGTDRQPGLHATSFVIASPAARAVMEAHPDPNYTYLGPRSLTDDWWNCAIETGLLSIANHSWDHLHPALRSVAHSRDARGDFTQVDNREDADAQIAEAARSISFATRSRSSPYFAYPFGQSNDYLVKAYFPAHGSTIGVRAAFTTAPRAIGPHDSRWSLPRMTCGHHWAHADELAALLSASNFA